MAEYILLGLRQYVRIYGCYTVSGRIAVRDKLIEVAFKGTVYDSAVPKGAAFFYGSKREGLFVLRAPRYGN